jgi:UDP-glucose 4-epimerase
MARILVTGGAGFIGSHLVDRLLEAENDVTVVDDMSHGSLRNLEGDLKSPHLHIHKGDFADPHLLQTSLQKMDVVIHLAALTSVPDSILNPALYEKVNVAGTAAILQACTKHSVGRFILASSAAVYGSQEPPLLEEMPLNSLSPYAASKVSAEAFVQAFCSSFGLESVILRFMNVYGPRSIGSNEGVVAKFLEAVKRERTLMIYGKGDHTRDYVHVSDVVDSIILAMATNASQADIFNVGTGRQTSVNGLVRLLHDCLPKSRLRIKHLPERKGEVKESYASISKASRVLGFAPKVELENGIADLLELERLR